MLKEEVLSPSEGVDVPVLHINSWVQKLNLSVGTGGKTSNLSAVASPAGLSVRTAATLPADNLSLGPGRERNHCHHPGRGRMGESSAPLSGQSTNNT